MVPPTTMAAPPRSMLVGSGWHPPLFRSEAGSFAEIQDVIHPRVVIVTGIPNISESSLIDRLLHPFSQSKERPSAESIASWFNDTHPNINQTVMVRVHRLGFIEDENTKVLEREVGALLHKQGRSIDLESPDLTLMIHPCGPATEPTHPESEYVNEHGWIWGVVAQKGQGGGIFASRSATDRAYFRPVSLDPRLARTMVNLTRILGEKPSGIIDPFCGTGGIIIEAALSDIHVFGSDLDVRMVEGSRQNLEQIEIDSSLYELFTHDATQLEELWPVMEGSAFVFDPPYGRNSWSDGEGMDLFQRTVQSCQAISTGCFVILLPISPEKTELIRSGNVALALDGEGDVFSRILSEQNLRIDVAHSIHVHRSLARLLLRLQPI